MIKKLLLGLGILVALVAFAPARATVTNTTTQTTTAYGNGSTTNFAISFDFRSNAWITVTKYDTSTSPATVTSVPQQTGALGFTISGGNPGTTVVMGTAPTSTQYLVISRSIPLTQGLVFNPATAFPYTGLSSQLDQITLTLQNLNAGIGNGSGSGGGSGSSGSLPSPGAKYDLIGWNSLGASTVNATVAYDAGQSTFQIGDVLKFNGSGWATYPLTQSNLIQTLNGSPNTPLAAASGGSGVTNSGSFTWGSNPITFTTTGTTALTLPTSGTLLSGTVDNNNTANAIVKRDGSGNFSAGTITASLTGNVTGNLTGNVTGNTSGTAANVTGIVALGNGGTGQTTRQSAINGLLNSSGASSGTFARYDGSNVTLDVLKITDMPQGFSRRKLAQDTANTLVTNDAQGNMSVLTGGVTGNVPIFNGTAWTVGPQGSGLAGIFPYGVDTGGPNAYVVASPNPPILGYSAGIGVSFTAANTNTGATTVDVQGLGPQAIVHADGTPLVAGDIIVGAMAIVEYDGTNFQLINSYVPQTGTLTVTGSVTASITQTNIVANCASACTITLPAISSLARAYPFYIKDINSGAVTVVGTGDNVDGAASAVLNFQWQAITVTPSSNGWLIQ